jgi:hypothetical protein
MRWVLMVMVGALSLANAASADRPGGSPYDDRPYWERNKIRLLTPGRDTRWQHGDKNRTWSWDPETVRGKVRFELWRGRQRVADLKRPVENDGQARLDDVVPDAWGSGCNFYIVAIDNRDRIGVSERFCIFGGVFVIQPSDVTQWRTGEKDKRIRWDPETAKGKVRIEILRGGTVLGEVKTRTENDGEAVMQDRVPEEWTTGDDYRIRVTDSKGRSGISESFRVVKVETRDRDKDEAKGRQATVAAPANEPAAVEPRPDQQEKQKQEAAKEERQREKEREREQKQREEAQAKEAKEAKKGKKKQGDQQEETAPAAPVTP